jgi:hypothetical protein
MLTSKIPPLLVPPLNVFVTTGVLMLVTTIEMAMVGDVSVFVAAALDISLFVSGL